MSLKLTPSKEGRSSNLFKSKSGGLNKGQFFSRFADVKNDLKKWTENLDQKIAKKKVPDNVKIKLKSDNKLHTSIIRADGYPSKNDDLGHSFKWFRVPPNGGMELLLTTESSTFQPCIDDIKSKICCQWVGKPKNNDTNTTHDMFEPGASTNNNSDNNPDDPNKNNNNNNNNSRFGEISNQSNASQSDLQSEYTSNIAETEALQRDPDIYNEAQKALDKGKHTFEVIIPKLNRKVPYNLIIEGTKIHVRSLDWTEKNDKSQRRNSLLSHGGATPTTQSHSHREPSISSTKRSIEHSPTPSFATTNNDANDANDANDTNDADEASELRLEHSNNEMNEKSEKSEKHEKSEKSDKSDNNNNNNKTDDADESKDSKEQSKETNEVKESQPGETNGMEANAANGRKSLRAADIDIDNDFDLEDCHSNDPHPLAPESSNNNNNIVNNNNNETSSNANGSLANGTHSETNNNNNNNVSSMPFAASSGAGSASSSSMKSSRTPSLSSVSQRGEGTVRKSISMSLNSKLTVNSPSVSAVPAVPPVASYSHTMRIKGDFRVELSRSDNCEFTVYNGKDRVMINGCCRTPRERDILTVVVRAVADHKAKTKKAKKTANDLVSLDITVLGGGKVAKMSPQGKRQLHNLEVQLQRSSDEVVRLQKEQIELRARYQKLSDDLSKSKFLCEGKEEEISRLQKEKKELLEEMDEIDKEKEKIVSKYQELEKENDFNENSMNDQLKIKSAMQEQVKLLTSQNADLNKELSQKDLKIKELQQECRDLEDDRDQCKQTLNHLNTHVSKVQDQKSELDGDFQKMVDEKVEFKREAREWRDKYNNCNRELDGLKHDYNKIESQYKLGENDKNSLKEKLEELKGKMKELKEENKKVSKYEKEMRDVKYEIASRDEKIAMLKSELQQKKSDLDEHSSESKKHKHKVQMLVKKLDKATAKNAKLLQQVEEFEDRVNGSVSRHLHKELETELNEYKTLVSNIRSERDKARNEVSELRQSEWKAQEDYKRLNLEHTQATEELHTLQSHNIFWKNKAKALQDECQKLMNSNMSLANAHGGHGTHGVMNGVNGMNGNGYSPTAVNQISEDMSNQLKKEVEMANQEKDRAIAAMKSYQKALNTEISKRRNQTLQTSLFKSHSLEDPSSLIKKNQDLLSLANDLSDAVADKEQNIKHMKAVMKLLGDRVSSLEKENVNLREQLGMKGIKGKMKSKSKVGKLFSNGH